MKNGPIDFVLMWVDDQDPAWQESKQFYQGEKATDREVNADNRYRDWGLFRYMFRAFDYFTPWVNHVYLVTCGHYPKWLNLQHPKLMLVRHDEFIPEEYLPTFSSHAIELNLHRIKGLSDRFVYFNDDMFPIRPMNEEAFFKNGLPRDIFVQSLLTPVPEDIVISAIQFNNLNLITKHFSKKEFLKRCPQKYLSLQYGRYFWRNLCFLPIMKLTGFRSLHSAASFYKNTFETLWETEYDTLHETCLRKFRNRQDISQYALAQHQIMSGDFCPINPNKRPYFVIGRDRERYAKTIVKQTADIVCLNDVEDVDFETEKAHLIALFEQILPNRSSYETDTV